MATQRTSSKVSTEHQYGNSQDLHSGEKITQQPRNKAGQGNRCDRDFHGGFVAEFTFEGSFRLNAIRQHASTARVTNSGDSTVIHDGTRELASGGS